MTTALRRYGPVVFWLYVWFLIVIAPLGLLTYWMAGLSVIGRFSGLWLVLLVGVGWYKTSRVVIRMLTCEGPSSMSTGARAGSFRCSSCLSEVLLSLRRSTR